MFEYRKFGEWVFVENIYKVKEEVFSEWILDKELQSKIAGFLETKKKFVKQSPDLKGNTQLKAFFTDALLLYELKYNKDITFASLDEIVNIIKEGLKLNNYKAVSTVSNYILLFAKITRWGYNAGLRSDYYNKPDFGIDETDYVDEQDVYTPKEMAEIFKEIEKEDVYICMMASLEGLTNKEVLNIKRRNFTSRDENVLINVGDREVKLSDKLYHAMYDYAQTVCVEKEIGNGVAYTVELNDSEKLIRSIKTKVTGEMTQTSLCININKHMEKIGYEGLSAGKSRSYAMYYDLLKNMDIQDFNFKYGTKFQHPRIVMKNEEIANKMKKKITQEL